MHKSELTIVLLNRDFMSASGTINTCKALGYECVTVPNSEEYARLIQNVSGSVVLGIVDMNAEIDWSPIAETLASGDAALPPVIAFGPHVDAEAMRAAKAAGVTRVTSNGQFRPNMADFIRRYANKIGT